MGHAKKNNRSPEFIKFLTKQGKCQKIIYDELMAVSRTLHLYSPLFKSGQVNLEEVEKALKATHAV